MEKGNIKMMKSVDDRNFELTSHYNMGESYERIGGRVCRVRYC